MDIFPGQPFFMSFLKKYLYTSNLVEAEKKDDCTEKDKLGGGEI